MAADSMEFLGSNKAGRVMFPAAPKIIRHDHAIIGSAGRTSDCERFAKWLRGGKASEWPFSGDDNFDAVCLMPDKTMATWSEKGGPNIIANEFYAIGPEMAIGVMFGAMAHGASAEEAVQYAIQWTDCAGGPVQVERL